MKKRKVHVLTYGCQMNLNDSEIILEKFIKKGFEVTDDLHSADFIILNTCTVRKRAEDKIYGKLNSISGLKKKKELKIAVCGCLAQSEQGEIQKKFPFVDLVFGPQDIRNLEEILDNIYGDSKNYVAEFDDVGYVPKSENLYRENDFKAWVTIIKGCNNFCSYCIVPYVRGREKSRNSEDIIKEVKMLVDSGVKEITLLGQNVNSYGNDLDENINFAKLLKKIDEIENCCWIRFITSHPKDISDELIDVIANSKNICPQIHLPLQSGSDKVLNLMNRKYTYGHYKKKIDTIKEKIKDVVLTTDMIVGFPQETEEDFQMTLDALNEIQYDYIFPFYYTQRKGTKAANFEGLMSEVDRKKRLQVLIDYQNEISKNFGKRFVGKEYDVLVESISKKDKKELSGRMKNFKLVCFEGDKSLIGKIVRVKIIENQPFVLKGEIIK